MNNKKYNYNISNLNKNVNETNIKKYCQLVFNKKVSIIDTSIIVNNDNVNEKDLRNALIRLNQLILAGLIETNLTSKDKIELESDLKYYNLV